MENNTYGALTVIPRKISKIFEYDNSKVLEANIGYPEFLSMRYSRPVRKINEFYSKNSWTLLKYAGTCLMNAAIAQYKFSKDNDFPFNEYELEVDFKVTLNQNCALSLYTDQYEYTGGAHGNTVRTSETWSLTNGEQIPLSAIFPNNPRYTTELKNEIKMQIARQISKGEDYYFENYAELVDKTFDADNFYLIPGGLVIYFQQYDIAPYSSGIPEFVILEDDIRMRMPKCR